MAALGEKLSIQPAVVDEINSLLTDPANPLIGAVLRVVEKYGTPEEINARAAEARKLSNLMARLREARSPYLHDLEWLTAQRDAKAFVSLADYEKKVLGNRAVKASDLTFAVTLEVSALQYFPWLIAEAKQAIERQELMPGRFIRVRKMKEQENDNGDILAVAAAMQIVGASYVETLDTKGTDGSNVHLGGPDTIAGYFGGVGSPNDYPLKWVDEYLYYYTNYGIQQVLNTNSGTVLLGYLLHKLGIDNQFKISVFMGNDNPYSILWVLLCAKLFSRADGTTPLIGFNFSNSVNNETIELCAVARKALDFEDVVRFEHHITETWRHIVRQPYNRRAELVEVAKKVANISAKHEGADPEIERERAHPSDVLDYFREKAEIESSGDWEALQQNYLDKHDAVNLTAQALIADGIPVVAARNLHG
ncbi:MAG TPA: hypothetical protein VF960_12425 [Chloroflexota bacterium]